MCVFFITVLSKNILSKTIPKSDDSLHLIHYTTTKTWFDNYISVYLYGLRYQALRRLNHLIHCPAGDDLTLTEGAHRRLGVLLYYHVTPTERYAQPGRGLTRGRVQSHF